MRRTRIAFAGLAALLAGCAGMGAPGAPDAPPGTVLATVPVGAPPTLLAVSPDGRHVYAASNNSLTIIDTASGAAAQRLTINPNTTGIAVAPDGRTVYVANLFSIQLTRLDTATNTLLQPLTMFTERLRGGFGFMAPSPDGRTMYIANRDNRSLGVIDLSGGRNNLLRPTVAPVALAVSADGRTVYSAGCKRICTPGFLNLYDVATQRFGAEIAVDGNPYRIVLAPNGATAYVASLTGPSVSFVDLATRAVTRTVRVPVQPTGLAIAPDGATLYVASQTEGVLTALDAASGAVRGQLRASQARDVAVTPDGRRVVLSAGEQVLVIDAAALVGAS